jgi:hypothetical protein
MEEQTAYYRNQAGIYTDAIRMSDFKANVAVIYGAFTIGPIIGSRSHFPNFIPVTAILFPYVIAFVCLLLCLLPRYPRSGRSTFPVSLTTKPNDFIHPDSESVQIQQQLDLCIVLCKILHRKTVLLRIAFSIYIAGTIGVLIYLLNPWK